MDDDGAYLILKYNEPKGEKRIDSGGKQESNAGRV
jgi:phage/plasmid primase-like uncharacterized protein